MSPDACTRVAVALDRGDDRVAAGRVPIQVAGDVIEAQIAGGAVDRRGRRTGRGRSGRRRRIAGSRRLSSGTRTVMFSGGVRRMTKPRACGTSTSRASPFISTRVFAAAVRAASPCEPGRTSTSTVVRGSATTRRSPLATRRTAVIGPEQGNSDMTGLLILFSDGSGGIRVSGSGVAEIGGLRLREAGDAAAAARRTGWLVRAATADGRRHGADEPRVDRDALGRGGALGLLLEALGRAAA